MDFKNKLPSKSKLSAKSAIIIALIGISAWQSGAMPFIPSESFINSLVWIGTPIVYSLFAYCIFFKKDKKTNLSIYQMNRPQFKSQLMQHIHKAISAVLLLPAISLLFSLISQWYPAWPTYQFTNENNAINTQVNKVVFNRKVGEYRLYLTDLQTNETFKFFWSEESATQMQVNDIIILHTKRNWFGDYIINITTKPVLN